jgi:hypothetical protein
MEMMTKYVDNFNLSDGYTRIKWEIIRVGKRSLWVSTTRKHGNVVFRDWVVKTDTAVSFSVIYKSPSRAFFRFVVRVIRDCF